MTEAEWLTSNDPERMLNACVANFYHVSDRKLRLFACACCRQVWHLLADERSRRAVEVAERYADGCATQEERHDALRGASVARIHAHPVGHDPWAAAYFASTAVEADVSAQVPDLLPLADVIDPDLPARLAALLRDILGNPFRPMTVPACRCRRCVAAGEQHNNGPCRRPAWLTPTVVSLTQAAYEERQADGTLDPMRLAVLADALEEAGCPPEMDCPRRRGSGSFRDSLAPCDLCGFEGRVPHPILDHLRSSGPHVRGCWALDLILGRE